MARYGITHHKAISVTSGYWVGGPDNEKEVMTTSGTLGSGVVTLNSIPDNTITLAKLATTAFDYGTTGFSGLIYSVSTRLTTVVAAIATPKYAQGELHASGKITTWSVDWSGGALDFQTAYVNTSTNTSAPACSGVLSWIALGT